MKQRLGKCTNFGNCPRADAKENIPITGGDDSCPTCGSQLTEFRSARHRWLKGVLVFVLLALVLTTGIWFGWLRPSSQSTDFTASMPTALEVEGTLASLAADDKCILEQSETQLTETSATELRLMLPLAAVDAVRKQPIPRDLHVWMHNVATISSAAFFIMRREVTVSEFKRYVATLSAQQQIRLGEDWQHDRNGTPLPDDYPVSSIPWSAAQAYADWLAQTTQCHLALPTYAQWVAAVVQWAKPEMAVTRQHQQAQYLHPRQRPRTPQQVFDLLGNLREWSQDNQLDDYSCPQGGHFILGEDYKTWLQHIAGTPRCETMALDTIGFRLVRLK
ncbi:MAG: SUMF1/EgtB/PvdO family nonheme iron enzyme [Pseudomonadota bacterium]|nr:SUMF1/EgtB/PvdO family nonheme iron enzyme [Pseudomonadota bacterium]